MDVRLFGRVVSGRRRSKRTPLGALAPLSLIASAFGGSAGSGSAPPAARTRGTAPGRRSLCRKSRAGCDNGDVFISASPTANQGLDSATRNLVCWYATFAKAPLVIGYNSNSQFASDFRSKHWYQVIPEPSNRIGRSDPALDPKGKLTVDALHRPGRR